MDTAAPSQVPAPNNLTRVRPAFRLLAIVTFVIVVPLAAWNSWDAIEARRVSRAVDGIRAAGEPVTFSFRPEYAGPEPPNDAGPDYIAAAVLAAANPTVNDRTLSRPGDPPGWESQSVASEFHDAVLAGVVPPTLQGATADALAMKEDALRLLDRATALSFKGFRPGTAYGYNGSDLISLLSLAAVRTMYLASTHDGAASAAAIRAELRLEAGPLGPLPGFDGPLTGYWLSQSTARLNWVLNNTTLSDAQLVEVDQALAPADDDGVLMKYVLEMRAEYISGAFDLLGPGYGGAHIYGTGAVRPTLFGRIERPVLAQRLLGNMAIFAKEIGATRGPWPGRTDAILSISKPTLRGGVVEHDVTAIVAGLAEARAARATLAVERDRLTHGGALPASLDDVVPAFLPSVPVDPFSGRALLYRRTSAGYVVYSVGPDRADDGGRLTGYEPLGEGRAKWPPATGDIGVRIGGR